MKNYIIALYTLLISYNAYSAFEDLLISELVVIPTNGEFIEIHNSGNIALNLDNIYITDATFSNGSVFYYNITTGNDYGGGGFSDFHARFPNGSSIQPGEYQTIALNGSDNFNQVYGINPTYELFEDAVIADSIPDLLEATNGSINQQGGLTNDGEVIILYRWDGNTDLIQDIDYVLWGDKVEAVDKTSISVDGPDNDSISSSYLNDTAITNQSVIDTAGHAAGMGWSRIDNNEGTENKTGGNGINGHDETSENLSVTFSEIAPTPNAAPGNIPLPTLLINEFDAISNNAEFVEIFDGGNGNTILDGFYLAFYEGSTDVVYHVINLNGFNTSPDGYLLIGNAAISADITIADNLINDGTAAIAIYSSAININDTVSVTDLVDAVVYGSNQPDDTQLLVLLNNSQPQINENSNGLATSESNARCSNGSGGQLNTNTFKQSQPTPGNINSLCPIDDYYASADPTNAQTLRNSLHNIIDDHTVYPYSDSNTDTWDVLSFADEDPTDSNKVWMVYKNNAYTWQGGGQQAYNREHTWPQTYGFSSGSLGTNNTARTDMHHLMLSDVDYNSDRDNLYFDNCNANCTERPTDNYNGVGGGAAVYPGNSNWFDANSFEVWNFRKGDIARAMFYMDVRYNGDINGEVDLQLTDNPSEIQNGQPKMGLLSVLLQWHQIDPVDAIELERMERIYSYQGNRNPFIDHPEWVSCIFANKCNFNNDLIFANNFE